MSSRTLWMGTCLATALAAVGGSAQEPDPGYDGPAPVNSTASLSAGADPDIQPSRSLSAPMLRGEVAGNPLGTYAGVVPGTGSRPPVPAAPNDARPTITWPGFQMRPDGSSRVFVQSTQPLTSQASASAGKFSVVLPGAKVAGGTNRLPLETRYFNTPVTRVNISVGRDNVTLTLDLRAEVSPLISSERGPAGYYFVYIDLPKGQYLRDAPAPSAPGVPGAPPAPEHPRAPAAQSAKSAASASSSADATLEAGASGEAGKAKASGKASGKAGIKLGL
jgi:hypothetical protein